MRGKARQRRGGGAAPWTGSEPQRRGAWLALASGPKPSQGHRRSCREGSARRRPRRVPLLPEPVRPEDPASTLRLRCDGANGTGSLCLEALPKTGLLDDPSQLLRRSLRCLRNRLRREVGSAAPSRGLSCRTPQPPRTSAACPCGATETFRPPRRTSDRISSCNGIASGRRVSRRRTPRLPFRSPGNAVPPAGPQSTLRRRPRATLPFAGPLRARGRGWAMPEAPPIFRAPSRRLRNVRARCEPSLRSCGFQECRRTADETRRLAKSRTAASREKRGSRESFFLSAREGLRRCADGRTSAAFLPSDLSRGARHAPVGPRRCLRKRSPERRSLSGTASIQRQAADACLPV